MTATTITKVADEVRNFTTGNGSFGAFKVMLEDGRIGEVTAKAENVAKRQEQFRAFIGTPTDLIVEDAGIFPDGNPKPLRVKLPQQAQGGSKGRDYVPRWTDTAEGWRESDERVDRRRALELAQAEGVGITTELAQKFYEWLRASVGGEGSNPETGSGTSGAAPKPLESVRPSTSRPESSQVGEGLNGSGDDSGEHQGGDGASVVATSSSSSPVPESVHIHEWKTTETTRPGWFICECGKAEKASKVSVLTAPVEERSDLA